MNCGGYLFKLARVTAGPGSAEPGSALKGNRPEAGVGVGAAGLGLRSLPERAAGRWDSALGELRKSRSLLLSTSISASPNSGYEAGEYASRGSYKVRRPVATESCRASRFILGLLWKRVSSAVMRY